MLVASISSSPIRCERCERDGTAKLLSRFAPKGKKSWAGLETASRFWGDRNPEFSEAIRKLALHLAQRRTDTSNRLAQRRTDTSNRLCHFACGGPRDGFCLHPSPPLF